jgi:ribulose-phosphate 3-epimerase
MKIWASISSVDLGELVDVAHLMVVAPETHLAALAGSGASRAAFHVEATQYPWRVAWMVRDLGMQVGVAINPATPSPQLSYLDEAIDFVNVLTTEPDFEGERLLPEMDRRVRQIAMTISASTTIQADGAMSSATLPNFARAGASEFVVGRALVAASDIREELASLREAFLSARPDSAR